jgi:hypothetical protein
MSTPTPAEIAYMEAHPDDSKIANLVACGAVTLGIAYIAVILRIVARTKTAFRMGADDYMIILSLVRSAGEQLRGQSELTRSVTADIYSVFCFLVYDLSLWHGKAHYLRHRHQRLVSCTYPRLPSSWSNSLT